MATLFCGNGGRVVIDIKGSDEASATVIPIDQRIGIGVDLCPLSLVVIVALPVPAVRVIIDSGFCQGLTVR